MCVPSFDDVLSARRTVAAELAPTPMWSYPVLDDVFGATVFVKHENVQPTGAFKVRGGITLLQSMPEEQRARGVAVYSTGNHAQSIAYASRMTGVSCVVVMPEGANETKALACRALDADVVLHGATMAEAAVYAERLAAEYGLRLVSPAEPELIAGVATCYLEMFESVPDIDVVVVAVGGGSGAAGACLVTSALAPRCQVIAVQAEGAPAGHDSWHLGELVRRPIATVAEGLATGCGYALPQTLLRAGLSGFVLVSDAQIRSAQRLMLSHAHTLAEGAGAAALAGALLLRDQLAGLKIGVVCTGGNASPAEVADVLAADPVSEPVDARAPAPV